MSEATSLPNSWLRLKLGDVINYGDAERIEPSDMPLDAWVLELEDIEKDTSKLLQRLTFAQRQSKSTKNRFAQGDVLYGKLRPYLNKVLIADQNGYCTTEIIPLKPNQAICGRYLFYWLKHPEFLDYVNSVSYGLNMPRLGTKEGLQAPLILAPLAEQRRIVAKLDSLFTHTRRARAELARIPPLVEHYRQAILAAAFRGDLTKELRLGNSVNEPLETFKQQIEEARYISVTEAGAKRYQPPLDPDWFPDIELPEGWFLCSVDQLTSLVQYGSSAKTSESIENGVPVLRMGNIADGKLDFTSLKYLPDNHEEFPDLLLTDGDILFNRTNSAELVGKTAVYRHSSKIRASFSKRQLQMDIALHHGKCNLVKQLASRIMLPNVKQSSERREQREIRDEPPGQTGIVSPSCPALSRGRTARESRDAG